MASSGPVQVYASRWMEAQAQGQGPPPLSVGFTYELTAGIIDKTKSNEEIAKEEVGPAAQPVLAYTTQHEASGDASSRLPGTSGCHET